MFVCVRWAEIRKRVEQKIKRKLQPENMVNCMLSGEDLWDAVNEWVEEIINKKGRTTEKKREDELKEIIWMKKW